MQVLTLEGVKAAARDYYSRGKLGAQCGVGKCEYESGNGVRCAVGAALCDETLAAIRRINIGNTATISKLVGNVVVAVEGDALDDIQEIQDTHDRWVNGHNTEAYFRQVIGLD